MKRIYLCAIATLIVVILASAGNGHFLLAENFFLHKGDKLNVKLFRGIEPQDDYAYAGPLSDSVEFVLYEGSKGIPLTPSISDTSIAIENYPMDDSGLALLQMKQNASQETDKDDLIKYLEQEDQKTAAKDVEALTGYRIYETYHRYLKTLVKVDKHSGSIYEKLLGDDYEIILKSNPYKMSYGDDVTAMVYFKGKPLAEAPIVLYIKTTSGSIYPQKLTTDQSGQVYFKLSREGIYLLRSLHSITGKNADIETWWASFTFAFSSLNQLPNTYKEFGFGDKH